PCSAEKHRTRHHPSDPDGAHIVRLITSVRRGSAIRAAALAAALGLALAAGPAASAASAHPAPAASAARTLAQARADAAPAYLENGYQNPVSAFQPVPRPDTRSCTVTAMQYDFSNSYSTGDYIGTLTPPSACAGPWSKVVLDWYGSVQGVQYDRLAGVWIGGAEVLRTSTPEPDAAGISWHVDRDISSYIPLLTKTQPLDVSLGNLINSTDTGVYHITLKVTYYTADRAN